MNFLLYTDVILLSNVAEENLQVGDIGTVVECHEVTGLETGYSVEFFDMLGNTVALATLAGSMLTGLTHCNGTARVWDCFGSLAMTENRSMCVSPG